MASLTYELQELFIAERGVFEGVHLLACDLEELDPDIANGLEDISQSTIWICEGLYHRITQLDATPTLLSNDFPRKLLEKPELEDQLKVLCEEQKSLGHKAGEILKRDDLDKPTCELVSEIKRLHQQAKTWCDAVLSQWKHESYLPP